MMRRYVRRVDVIVEVTERGGERAGVKWVENANGMEMSCAGGVGGVKWRGKMGWTEMSRSMGGEVRIVKV